MRTCLLPDGAVMGKILVRGDGNAAHACRFHEIMHAPNLRHRQPEMGAVGMDVRQPWAEELRCHFVPFTDFHFLAGQQVVGFAGFDQVARALRGHRRKALA